jgi:TolB-like protein
LKHRVAFVLLVLAALPLGAINVAVSTFRVSGRGVGPEYQDLLVDLYTAELSRFPAVKVVERRRLDAVLREQELALSDLVDSNTAIASGRILGSAYIVTGSLMAVADAYFVSVQVIDNTTGQVVVADDRELSKLGLAELRAFSHDTAAMLAASLAGGGSAPVASLWLTKSSDERARPILIYIMSTGVDSTDPSGQWYYGPQHIKPVTDALRKAGFGVQVHDRRSLASLAAARLADYSQVWLLEGDANATVNVTAKDVASLYNYYINGGGVWLSGENVLDPRTSSWLEDINAFAAAFDARLEKTVIASGRSLPVPAGAGHPLLAGITELVFDREVAQVAATNPAIVPLVRLDPRSRALRAGLRADELWGLSDPARYKELQSGRDDWSFSWLLGANYAKIGPAVGDEAIAIAVADERPAGSGRLVLEGGWLLGWAFNGDRDGGRAIGDDLRFVVNAAAWLGR